MTQFIGIDTSEKRGCAMAAIDEAGRSTGSRWSTCDVADVVAAVRALAREQPVVIGIDSPRLPLDQLRSWYWNRKAEDWRPRKDTEQGWGRHCEVVVSSLGLATPQWTRPLNVTPGWMRFGFQLFEALESIGPVHEVFPTASYSQLRDAHEPLLQFPFSGFAGGPKDLLDAYVAAVTISEYEKGRGSSVGGGDLLGNIVLPRPVSSTPTALFAWPDRHAV